MAELRHPRRPRGELRENLARRYRELDATYGYLGASCPYARQAAALEAGEAVPVPAWQIPAKLRPFVADNYTLTADDELVACES